MYDTGKCLYDERARYICDIYILESYSSIGCAYITVLRCCVEKNSKHYRLFLIWCNKVIMARVLFR